MRSGFAPSWGSRSTNGASNASREPRTASASRSRTANASSRAASSSLRESARLPRCRAVWRASRRVWRPTPRASPTRPRTRVDGCSSSEPVRARSSMQRCSRKRVRTSRWSPGLRASAGSVTSRPPAERGGRYAVSSTHRPMSGRPASTGSRRCRGSSTMCRQVRDRGSSSGVRARWRPRGCSPASAVSGSQRGVGSWPPRHARPA